MARIAVLGAGGVGSAAARFLVREGHEVTVVEQFEPDHGRIAAWMATGQPVPWELSRFSLARMAR